MSEALRVANVIKRFGGITALADVNLAVSTGEVHGLIGPNGAGKTTLINLVSGWLDQPDAGSVYIEGKEMTGLRPLAIARSGVARTFQHIRLFGHLSALENVVVGMHIHRGRSADLRTRRAARSRAQVLLESAGVEQGYHQDASELPYGVQRRVEIARALAIEPRILLLDEPVAGMNDAEAASISRLARELAASGMAVVVVEHNMAFVREACDVMTVLDFGRVIASGTPEECLQRPDVRAAYLGIKADAAPTEGQHD